MSYICTKCGRETKNIEDFVRCPYCGNKILIKGRPNIPREITTD
jgi:DNA-directed RNA polymerase subunit RPC12/RpoP